MKRLDWKALGVWATLLTLCFAFYALGGFLVSEAK